MKNARVQQLVMIVAVMVVVYFLFNCMDKSDYSIQGICRLPRCWTIGGSR